MNPKFTIKQGDTIPNIKAQLLDSERKPVDLTEVLEVYFHLEDRNDNELIFEKSAVIENAEEGIVYYDWQAEDTENSGKYQAEWKLLYNDDNVERFPNGGYIEVNIVRKIN